MTREELEKEADDYVANTDTSIGWFVAIECKRSSGGRLSPAQKERIADINRKGGVAFVAHSGEEALQKLKEKGCI